MNSQQAIFLANLAIETETLMLHQSEGLLKSFKINAFIGHMASFARIILEQERVNDEKEKARKED